MKNIWKPLLQDNNIRDSLSLILFLAPGNDEGAVTLTDQNFPHDNTDQNHPAYADVPFKRCVLTGLETIHHLDADPHIRWQRWRWWWWWWSSSSWCWCWCPFKISVLTGLETIHHYHLLYHDHHCPDDLSFCPIIYRSKSSCWWLWFVLSSL